jgi:putative transposase
MTAVKKAMKQVITAKLKLDISEQHKQLLREVSLSYRDALNHASKVAFENGKVSSGTKLQSLVYRELRSRFGLPAQMACNVPRFVANTYKVLWTKVRQNTDAISGGKTRKRYKGLDKPPAFVSRTCTLNYGRDYSFTKQGVSIITLQGRIKVPYFGYSKHVELIRSGNAKIGAAKIYYARSSKTYYLLVSLELELSDIEPTDIKQIKGVDLGQRYLAVSCDTANRTQFFKGKEVLHKAQRYHKARKALQSKGTRSAKRRLILLSGRERRHKLDVNHRIAKQIVSPNTLIGLEDLTHIRERIIRRSSKKSSLERRKANSNQARWAFAELGSFIDYKAVLSGSLATKIDAYKTSQQCVRCGHSCEQNRPNKGLIFRCTNCSYELHADLLGARNICLRTLLVRQDWTSTGCLSASPNVSSDEAKALNRQRFGELRWTIETSSD